MVWSDMTIVLIYYISFLLTVNHNIYHIKGKKLSYTVDPLCYDFPF